ncbi:hypothetical protein K0U83_07270 [bacterium]|nr:hypothetical protein [bacterium]
MGMFSRVTPPRPTAAPPEYTQTFMDQMQNISNLFFQQINAVQPLNVAGLNIDTKTLPTQADLADLRVGDVYLDTSASNVLKVKV